MEYRFVVCLALALGIRSQLDQHKIRSYVHTKHTPHTCLQHINTKYYRNALLPLTTHSNTIQYKHTRSLVFFVSLFVCLFVLCLFFSFVLVSIYDLMHACTHVCLLSSVLVPGVLVFGLSRTSPQRRAGMCECVCVCVCRGAQALEHACVSAALLTSVCVMVWCASYHPYSCPITNSLNSFKSLSHDLSLFSVVGFPLVSTCVSHKYGIKSLSAPSSLLCKKGMHTAAGVCRAPGDTLWAMWFYQTTSAAKCLIWFFSLRQSVRRAHSAHG